jgi:hypothetical protein
MYRGKSGYYVLQQPMKFINKNSLLFMSVTTLNEILGTNFVERGGKLAVVKYKSKLEEKFLRFIDTNPNVKQWGYELVVIPYIFEGKQHKYYIDIFVELVDGRKEIWEIKPFAIIKQDKDFFGTNMDEEYARNTAKWNYARDWADRNNMKFRIISE